ncbi:BTB/POZ domain-containing protein At1g55760-like [Curcuma longa]|uniref:BTB/POZ domain-containing protein At1g55760-like n=1 Tax=Curcuma longa TaxID=136217 RepID=UPI003D9FAA25
MNEQAYRVETAQRLAQWRIENIASCTYRKSDPFKVGLWNWYLSVEKNKQLYVKLFPEMCNLTRKQPPIASFNIKFVSVSSSSRKTVVHPEVCDKLLKNNDDFVLALDDLSSGRLIIDIEFLDLKILPSSGGEPSSIWSNYHIERRSMNTTLACLGQMLTEGIHTDITVNAADGGSISAHRAILAARSPVFRSMFSHNLREKELSAVNISDMSLEACRAFLHYIYGNFQPEEFLSHRIALLHAADKYDVSELKEACHDSLLEDMDASNVLERLQAADLYCLPRLKSACMRYLVNFGKIYEIRDEFNAFIETSNRDLIAEIFQEILAFWKGF